MQTILYKSQAAQRLGISLRTLARYCNERFYDELKNLGYTPTQKYLTVNQIEYITKNLC